MITYVGQYVIKTRYSNYTFDVQNTNVCPCVIFINKPSTNIQYYCTRIFSRLG